MAVYILCHLLLRVPLFANTLSPFPSFLLPLPTAHALSSLACLARRTGLLPCVRVRVRVRACACVDEEKAMEWYEAGLKAASRNN